MGASSPVLTRKLMPPPRSPPLLTHLPPNFRLFLLLAFVNS